MSREAEVAYEVCDGVAVLGDYGANEADEAVEHHEHVEPVCSPCHHQREANRHG